VSNAFMVERSHDDALFSQAQQRRC
jgi:hypothetical protein